MKRLINGIILTAIWTAIFIIGGGVVTNAEAARKKAGHTNISVKMVAGLTDAEQAAVIAKNGGIEVKSIAPLRIHVIHVPHGHFDLIVEDYKKDPQVESVEVIKSRKSKGIPNDHEYGVQWGLSKIGWESVYGTYTPTGTAKVALLDTGVDATHGDLAAHILVGTSTLDNSDGLTDPSGHGTQMAGIIAAVTDNSSGMAGVGFSGVQILPVTVLDATNVGQDDDIISGIVWAVEKAADVILMAFSNSEFSQHLQDAINYAWEKGAVLVAAVGNDSLTTPTFPAGDSAVIGVSATDQNDVIAPFSNTGSQVYLAAPGTDIYTTAPGNTYTYASGTSHAAATVAGVAAFMKALDPTLTNGMIVDRLGDTADQVGDPTDPNNALKYGKGRVNMAKALQDKTTDVVTPTGTGGGTGGWHDATYTAGGLSSLNGNSCISCHAVPTPSPTYSSIGIETSINAGASTIRTMDSSMTAMSITVLTSSTFEVDWKYTNLKTAGNSSVGNMITAPTGWTIAPGTANNPPISNWKTVWDVAGSNGVSPSWSPSWATTNSAAKVCTSGITNYTCYFQSYNGSPWVFSSGTRDTANDTGTTGNPGDQDGVPNAMGTDAKITVGATAGTYTIYLYGIGHYGAGGTNNKASVEQDISVTVVAPTGTPYYSKSTGTGDPTVLSNWNTTRTGSGSAPSAFTSGTFVIQKGHTMTQSANWSPANLFIESGGTLTMSGSPTLTLSGSGTPFYNNGTFNPATSTVSYSSTSATNIAAVNYYNLNGSSGASGARTLPTSGTVGIAGTFTPAAGTGTYTTTGSTVNFNGTGSQTVPALAYNNLTLSGGSTKTLPSSGTFTIGGAFSLTGASTSATTGMAMTGIGSLSIGSGATLNVGGFNFGVTGTTAVTGTLDHNNNTGTKTYTGLVTVNSGGNLTNTNNAPLTFTAGLSNSGTVNVGNGTASYAGVGLTNATGGLFTSGTGAQTFSAGGLTNNGTTFSAGSGSFTFQTATQGISGAATTIPVLTANIGVTNNITATGGLTVSTTLAGNSSLTQAASSILNIGAATFTLTTLTPTGIGNTVNYTGASQAVKVATYQNLGLTGSGTPTGAVTTVGGNLNIGGTVNYTTGAALAVAGSLTVGSGSTLATTSTNTLSVGTTTDVTGTLTLAGTGAKTFTGNATINANGIWQETGIAAINFAGSLTNNGTYTATANTTGVHTFSGTSKIISGTGEISMPYVDITGTTTNNGTFTVATAFSTGAGTLTNGSTGILNIKAATVTPTLAASTAGNTVNYTAAANQTVKGTTYANLGISGGSSAVKTLGAATTATGLTVAAGTTLDTSTLVLTLSGGTHNINGTLKAGAAMTLSSSPTLNINSGGTYQHNHAGLTIPAATWNYASTPKSALYITGATGGQLTGTATNLGDVKIESTLTSELFFTNSNSTIVYGDFYVARTSTATPSATNHLAWSDTLASPVADIRGNLQIQSADAVYASFEPFHAAGGIIRIGGNFIQASGTGGGSALGYWETPTGLVYTVEFNGTNGTISGDLVGAVLTNAVTFNHIINAGKTYTLAGNVSTVSSANLTNTITVNGTLDLADKTLIAGSAGTTTLAMGSTGLLKVGGANNFPSGFDTYTVDNGTVEYDLTGDQTISVQTYHDLTLSGSGLKTMSASTAVDGILSISPADSATARIASGANLVVNSLKLGGSTQSSGTYGATTSSAVNKDDTYFDNIGTPGILTVGATRLAVTLPGQTFTSGSGNSGTVSGQAAGTPFNITLSAVDTNNNIDTNYSGSKTVSYSGPTNASSGSQPTYTTTVTFTSGQATTVATTLVKAETTTITATISGLTAGDSSSLTVSGGTASKLTFTTQPGGGTGGTAWLQQPVVKVYDQYENIATSSSASITLAASSGTFSCTTNPLAAVSGQASFAGCKTNEAATGYTLSATATSLTSATSSSFDISVGAAAKLGFTTQPSSSTVAGVAFETQPVVKIQDAGGNTVTTATDSVTLSLTTGAGTFGGTKTMSAVGGIADFAGKGLNIDLVGTDKVLTATSGTLTSATTSPAFTITFATANKLAFTTQPSSSTVAGVAFATQPVVTIQDTFGNTVTSAINTVDLTLTAGAGTLGGTVSMSAVAGVANFSGKGVNINLVGADKALTASASGLTSAATSPAFAITAATASKLVITGSATQTAGATQNLTITAYDLYGNVATGYTGTKNLTFSGASSSTNPVTVPKVKNSGGTATNFGLNTTITFTNGVASVSGGSNGVMALYKVETATVSATDGAISSSGSDRLTVTVSAASASQAGFTTQPSSSTGAGVAFATQPVVAIQDAYGNTITSAADEVTLSLTTGTGTLGGTLSMNAVSGVADFVGEGLNIDLIGSDKVLTAAATGLASGTTSAFTITAGTATKLGFAVQPDNTGAGATITPAVTVQVQDQYGNLVSSSSASVSLAIGTNPGSGTLTGGGATSAVSGTATFSGLSINKTGIGYTLTASSSGLTGATSSSFIIGNTRYARATGNWNGNIWAATTSGTAGSAATPVAGDIVYIGDTASNTGLTVTIPSGVNNAACAALYIGSSSAAAAVGTLSFADATTRLDVNGNVTMYRPGGSNSITSTIALGAGTMTVGGDLVLSKAGSTYTNATRKNEITISSGNMTVSGDLTLNASTLGQAVITFTGAGSLKIGGAFTLTNSFGTLTPSTGTVEFNGTVAQTIPYMSAISYNNLTLSGGSTKTAGAALTVGGNLSVGGSAANDANTILDMGTYALTLTGSALTPTYPGTIKTRNTTSTPLSSGKNWGGTVEYYALTGSQTVMAGTYNNLTLSNTSGTQTASGGLTVNGTLSNLETLDMVTYALGGTVSPSNTGTIKTQNTSSAPLTTGKSWGGIVEYNAASGGQTVMAGTYNNLTLSNTSGTQTASGGLTVNGTLTNPVTLDMAAYTLGGALTSSNTGTIKTQNTSSTPLTTGISWGGTVEYNAASGGQTVMAGNYNYLTLSNTSGTQAASGNISATTLHNDNASSTLNMGANTLDVTSPNNSGTIRTQNTSSTPLTTGKTWGGTVQYDATSGGQTVMAGTYSTLTMGNTSNTQTASGNITSTTFNNSNSGSALNMVTYTLGVSGTPNNSGTIRTQNTSSTPITTGKTWGGTVQYDATSGGQTVMAGTYNNLTMSNASGTQTASGDLTVNLGTLTIANGASLDTAGYIVTGTGAFTLASGGTLGIGSAAGIASSGATGSIQSSGTRTFSTGANYIFNGTSGAQATGSGTPATVNNLTVNNASGLTLSGSTAVSGILDLTSGKITTGANTLTIGSAGSITGGSDSSYIYGTLLKTFSVADGQSFTFPVGDAGRYAPVAFDTLNVTTGGTITATTTSGDHASLGTSNARRARSANRFWTLSNSGAAFTGNATFNYNAADLDASADPTQFIVQRYASSAWTSPTTGTRTSTSAKATGLDQTTLGDFALGQEKLTTTLTVNPNPTSVVYNGAAQVATFSMSSPEYGTVGGTASQVTVTKNVGTYTVTADFTPGSGVASGSYTYADEHKPLTGVTAVGSFVITKKALTVSGITANNKMYDATRTATLVDAKTLQTAEATGGSSTTSDGTPYSGDDVYFGNTTPAGTFDTATVGIGKTVAIAGLTLAGASAGNYSVTQPTTTAEIFKANVMLRTYPTASSIYYGQTLADSTLSGGSATMIGNTTSVPGVFAFTSGQSAPVLGSNLFSVTFTPNDTTNFNTALTSASVTMAKAKPSVSSWPTVSGTLVYGQKLSTLTLSGGTAAVAGSFDFTAPTTVPPVGSGTYSASVTFTPSDTTDYSAVTGTASVTITKGTATVTLTNLSQQYTGGQLPISAVTSPGGLAVAFTYDGSATAPTVAGNYAVVGTVNDANYSGTGTGTFVIRAAAASVSSWPTASAINYGQTLASSTLSGGVASVPGRFAFTSPATVPPVGNTVSVTFTPNDITVGTVVGTINVPVNTRALTIKANELSKGSGDADPALTYVISSGTLISGDLVCGTLGRASGTAIGAYSYDYSALYIANGSCTPENSRASSYAVTYDTTPNFYIDLKIVVTKEGSGTVTGPATARLNSVPELALIPDSGNRLESYSLTVDGETTTVTSINAYKAIRTALVNGKQSIDSVSLHAVFASNTVPVTSSVGSTGTATACQIAGGTITPLGTVNTDVGATPTYYITPSAGCMISDVKVGGSSVGAVSTYKFAALASAKTITAYFTDASVLTPQITSVSPTLTNNVTTSLFTITGQNLSGVNLTGNYVNITGPGTVTYTFKAVSATKVYLQNIKATAAGTYTIRLKGTAGLSADPQFTFTVN